MKKQFWKDAAFSVFTVLAAFGLNLLIQRWFDTRSLIPMIFVLGVFLISWRTQGYFWGIAASLVSVLAVNYAFTFPYLRLRPHQPGMCCIGGGHADRVHFDGNADNPDQAPGKNQGRGGAGTDAGQFAAGGIP